ncbi:hypothetical protein PATY110618_11860 [Paenibacillus typhae]|uniref:Uncharacterized protein n=1 Tax=Paenibacillus typhae TaxID=1174501 RepID=A0A1G8XTP2_9BACL|nr:hypothetical protein SAMN05216192_12730 [Paenibacillus typhae]
MKSQAPLPIGEVAFCFFMVGVCWGMWEERIGVKEWLKGGKDGDWRLGGGMCALRVMGVTIVLREVSAYGGIREMRGESAFDLGAGGGMCEMRGKSAFDFGFGGGMCEMRGKNALDLGIGG